MTPYFLAQDCRLSARRIHYIPISLDQTCPLAIAKAWQHPVEQIITTAALSVEDRFFKLAGPLGRKLLLRRYRSSSKAVQLFAAEVTIKMILLQQLRNMLFLLFFELYSVMHIHKPDRKGHTQVKVMSYSHYLREGYNLRKFGAHLKNYI